MRKRPRQAGHARRRLPSRNLVQRLIDAHDRRAIHRDRPAGPTRRFLARAPAAARSAGRLTRFTFSANVQDGKIQEGLVGACASKPSAYATSASAPAELDRAKMLDVGVHGARVQRTRQDRERRRSRRSISTTSSTTNPRRASRTNTASCSSCCRPITPAEISDARAHAARRRQPRAARRLAAESQRQRAVGGGSADGARVGGTRRPSPRGPTRRVTRELLVNKPAACGRQRRDARSPPPGITVVRFANGVEAWLKPTDFKNDQVIFRAWKPPAARRSRRARTCPRPRSPPRYVGLSGVGGLKALDLQKMLAGKLASASAVHRAVDARHFRQRGAGRTRNGAAAALPGLHGAQRRPGRLRAAHAAARRRRRQPRTVAAAGVRRARGRRSTRRTTARRSR